VTTIKNKIVIAFAILLTLSIVSSALADVTKSPGDTQKIYAFINVGPNPVGVNQTVTVNFLMAAPFLTSELAQNWTVVEIKPNGDKVTLGPFVSDMTGGSYTTVTPDMVGDYTFQAFFAQQTLSNGVIALAAQSNIATLVVQDEPVSLSHGPITPLPTEYWQTPVTAENVQLWYQLAGPWLGFGAVSFGATGGYNITGNYNPYTQDVLSGHVLWTKVWAGGGVSGLSNNQESGHYWSTSQYQPKYAPVIINGIMYSQWYPESSTLPAGILATDLYTGQTLWRINTTNALRCGMVTNYHSVNQYGAIGPFIWTTGPLPGVSTAPRTTQWNMYSGLTGDYILSIVNGTNPTLTTDEDGNIIGYYVNSTRGTERTYPLSGGVVQVTSDGPHLTCWNLTRAIGQGFIGWQPAQHTVRDWQTGVMWTKPLPNETNEGEPINNYEPNNPTMVIRGITNNEVVLISGVTFDVMLWFFNLGSDYGAQQNGWLVCGAMDKNTGDQLWARNVTLSPDSRINMWFQNGKLILDNMALFEEIAIDTRTGATAWTAEHKNPDGTMPNVYDVFGVAKLPAADHRLIQIGYGGDIWCLNDTNGEILWQTSTNELLGPPGLETPYGTWPLWVFGCHAASNNVAYIAVGHEYNPPLFHGAQLLALNVTDGTLIWSELDMSIESTSIAYGVLLSRNAYDNQIYAFGKGPSALTVEAPLTAITQGTSVIIRGTVMDVSPGTRAIVQPDVTKTKQNEVALRFPNGVPCVSDESQSKWMEYVYQQQAKPEDVEGVKVFLKIQDPNGDYYSTYVTTDENGRFSHMWDPAIVGEYHVTAMFEGSNSYWPSEATTTFGVDEAPAAEHVPTATEIADTTVNRLPAYPAIPEIPAYLTIDIIILVIAAVGVVIGLIAYMALRKQK
jgi:outer membrane protein assembly factor BamB